MQNTMQNTYILDPSGVNMPVINGPRCNRRVSCSTSPLNARSESVIVINPQNPYNIIAASKKFTDPSSYKFILAPYSTFDGGASWIEAPPLPLQPGWVGASDPAAAWDNQGNAYLVALPFKAPEPEDDIPIAGIAVYKSTDSGRTWGYPALIHSSKTDDKQWAAGDVNPNSPHCGNIYATWDDGNKLCFARSTNHGTIWKGAGTDPPGSVLAFDSFSPELSVAADGSIYIVWLNGQSGNKIKFVKSTDGGNYFSSPQEAASGIISLRGALQEIGGWPVFPGANFRVLTLATGCTGLGDNVIFAWADMRDGVSRIYYRYSTDGGNTWKGSDSGQPLLTGATVSGKNQQDFHPQLISTPNGEIGCAFYEFGPLGGGDFPSKLIRVYLAISTNKGKTFSECVPVTDRAWNPTIGAPFVHGNANVTFIGEYFGLDASRLGFFPLWTDTRTGMQELFMSRIAVNPTDVYIRDDSASDLGDVPSPTYPVPFPDLIIRTQPDGDITFVDESVDWENENYVYGRVVNRGENMARNVKLVVTLVKYASPSLTYPEDWYPDNWNQSQSSTHLFLGESNPIDVPANSQAILGPISWFAGGILTALGYSLLTEVRADNDDSAGGQFGCEYPYDQDGCGYSTFASGSNNICVRSHGGIQLPDKEFDNTICRFILKNCIYCPPTYIEILLDKDIGMATTPITLQMEKLSQVNHIENLSVKPVELEFLDTSRFVIRMEDQALGEISAAAGTVWRSSKQIPSSGTSILEAHFGGHKIGNNAWKLSKLRSGVAFMAATGEIRNVTLSFNTQKLKAGTHKLHVTQRINHKTITGNVVFDII